MEQYITPNGDAEFYGATNVLRFNPGEVEKSVTIIAKGDGVPEVSGILDCVITSHSGFPQIISDIICSDCPTRTVNIQSPKSTL